MASRMSSIRSRHDLRGTNGVPKDSFPHGRPESIRRDEVHPAAQGDLKAPPDPNEVEESRGSPELDENVHVAVGPILAPGGRPEKSQ